MQMATFMAQKAPMCGTRRVLVRGQRGLTRMSPQASVTTEAGTAQPGLPTATRGTVMTTWMMMPMSPPRPTPHCKSGKQSPHGKIFERQLGLTPWSQCLSGPQLLFKVCYLLLHSCPVLSYGAGQSSQQARGPLAVPRYMSFNANSPTFVCLSYVESVRHPYDQ